MLGLIRLLAEYLRFQTSHTKNISFEKHLFVHVDDDRFIDLRLICQLICEFKWRYLPAPQYEPLGGAANGNGKHMLICWALK